MTSQFRHVALIGKYPASGAASGTTRAALEDIAQFLSAQGCEVSIERETALHADMQGHPALDAAGIGAQCDLALVVGGDGTMLGIARQLAPFRVPLIGVNQGRLGFMTDIPSDRMLPVLGDMLDGKLESEQRTLLEGTVVRDGHAISHGVAFNDVVVARGSGTGMIELRVNVDGHFMYNQRSDGLIVATPTGSTAYALSAGGPLLQPQLGGIVMVPIAPHALSNRPIVLSDDRVIEIELSGGRDCSVNFDMQSVSSLQLHDRVLVKRSQHKVTFLHPKGWSYFDTLREKLHWNEYPSTAGQLK